MFDERKKNRCLPLTERVECKMIFFLLPQKKNIFANANHSQEKMHIFNEEQKWWNFFIKIFIPHIFNTHTHKDTKHRARAKVSDAITASEMKREEDEKLSENNKN